jgi:hypothetical protein
MLEKINVEMAPFSWVDYEYYPNSAGNRKEIYNNTSPKNIKNLIVTFRDLFNENLSNLIIGQPNVDMEWGQFCIETWNIENDSIDYSFENKSIETIAYLNLLLESGIEFNYKGLCKCKDWDNLLTVVLPCIVNHKAPYSLLFYDIKNNYFFYFHHSFSIGFYYKEKNQAVINICEKIEKMR